MEEQGLDAFIFVVEGIVLTTVSSLGILGTIMSIYVLLKPRLRDCFSTFLTALAICDTVFLFFAILMFGLPMLWTWYGNYVLVHIARFSHGAIHIARMGSVYITMSVTLERFFAVVYPLRNFTAKKYLLPGTAAFSIAYNIPKFLEIETYIFSPTNETAIRSTEMRKDPLYESLYIFWSKLIVMEILPYLTLIILNTFIVWKIVQSSRFRRRFRPNEATSSTYRSGTTQMSLKGPNQANNPAGKGSTSRAGGSISPDRRASFLSGSSCSPGETGRQRRSTTDDFASSETTFNAAEKRKKCFTRSANTIDSAEVSVLHDSRETPTPIQPSLSLSTQQSQNMPRKQEVNLAITLLFISLLFIVCQSVKLITDVYELFCEKTSFGGKVSCASNTFIEHSVSIANLSSCINSAANFLVYMLRGKKFRELFLETYFCRKSRYGGNGTAGSRRGNVSCSRRAKHEATVLGQQLADTKLIQSPTHQRSEGSQTRSFLNSLKQKFRRNKPEQHLNESIEENKNDEQDLIHIHTKAKSLVTSFSVDDAANGNEAASWKQKMRKRIYMRHKSSAV